VFANLGTRIRRAWLAAPVATAVLALALVACLFFGARTALFWYGGPPHAVREQPVAAWMTPRYVARSWRIPPEVIIDGLIAPLPRPERRMNLRQLAEYRGVPVEQIIAEAEALIAAQRAKDAGAEEPVND